MRRFSVVLAVPVLLSLLTPAEADWLEDAWSSKVTALHGTPAITVHPDGVSVVLPAATLDQALAEHGLTQADVLRAFLNRYGPQCSHVLNLNAARPNLKVELQIEAAMLPSDASAATLDEMTTAMETVEVPSAPNDGAKIKAKDRRAQIPHIAQAFRTLPERSQFSIDYAPEKIVHCVAPEDPVS
jgi:hypothetical protein